MNYSDRIFLAISQNARFGTLVRVAREREKQGMEGVGGELRPHHTRVERAYLSLQLTHSTPHKHVLISQRPDISQVRRQRSPARCRPFIRRERPPRQTGRSPAPHLRAATGRGHQQVLLPTTIAFHFPARAGSGHVREAHGMGTASALSESGFRKRKKGGASSHPICTVQVNEERRTAR